MIAIENIQQVEQLKHSYFVNMDKNGLKYVISIELRKITNQKNIRLLFPKVENLVIDNSSSFPAISNQYKFIPETKRCIIGKHE